MRVLNSKISNDGPVWIDWRNVLRARWAVRNPTGSLKGTLGGTSFGGCDQRFTQACLTDEGRDWPRQLSDARYVVWSYNTPIAWLTIDDEWIIPDITYSRTTSQHQGLIRTAISQLSAPADDTDYILDQAAKATLAARLALIEYDAVGLPRDDGPLDTFWYTRPDNH